MSNLKLYERMAAAYPDLCAPEYLPYPLARMRYYKNMRRKNRQINCIYTLNNNVIKEDKKRGG